MNVKELVDRINVSPTMLVKVKFGAGEARDTVIAKPATYDKEKEAAIVYLYNGPLDPERWARIRDANKEEHVNEWPIQKGADVGAFSTYETELDAMPLRELPLWAKELWVRQMEQSTDYSVIDVNRHYKIEMMRKLIAQEGRSGGLSPDMMSDDMKARYLKLWYSFEVIMREISRGMTVDSLRTIYSHLKTVSETVPKIRELPWRNEEGLDPNSWFNREDTYEAMTDMLHSTMESLLLIIQRITADKRTEGNKDG